MNRRTKSHAKKSRPLRHSILVSCEGTTERTYLENLKRQRWKEGTVSIHIVNSTSSDLKSLVKQALYPTGDFTQRWIICDTDENEKHHNVLQSFLSKENARAAITFPCFEYWITLHYTDYAYSQSCNEAKRQLRKHIPNYSKGKIPHDIISYVDAARDREHKNPHRESNVLIPTKPSSGMANFIDTIDELAQPNLSS